MDDKCSACGNSENLQNHHLSYDPEILVTLCISCHVKVHNHGTERTYNTKVSSKSDPLITKGELHPNGQITVPKLKRQELGIETNDTIYFKIVRVITDDGKIKFEEKESEIITDEV